jgi:hypothetical protein
LSLGVSGGHSWTAVRNSELTTQPGRLDLPTPGGLGELVTCLDESLSMRCLMPFGRPTLAAVERRRRTVLRALVESALRSREAIANLSKEVRVGKAAIRADLEALVAGASATLCAPADLAAALRHVRTPEELLAVVQRLLWEIAIGRVGVDHGRVLLDGCRVVRQTLVSSMRSDGTVLTSGLDRVKAGEDTRSPENAPPADPPADGEGGVT